MLTGLINDQVVNPKPPAIASLNQMLKELTHDLNSVYSVISYAAQFLSKQPDQSEREELEEV